MSILVEDTRQQLINKSKSGADYKGDKSKGRNRYARRTHSKISSSVKEYNNIDMNKFFKDDILDFEIKVHGETDDYMVRLSFSGILDKLKDVIAKNNGKFDFRIVTKALIECFNKDDVYIFCSCPDFHFRFGYWLSVHDIIVGQKETRPSDITNPDDDLGAGCKHICLVLQNLSWVYKLSATISNYINYMESHYKIAYRTIIYPKLYGQEYEEPSTVKPEDEIGTDTGLIDIANKYGAERGKFKPGNTQGIRFSKATDEPIIDNEEVAEEEQEI